MKTMYISSVRRQKGLTGYCLSEIDRPFRLQTDDIYVVNIDPQINDMLFREFTTTNICTHFGHQCN